MTSLNLSKLNMITTNDLKTKGIACQKEILAEKTEGIAHWHVVLCESKSAQCASLISALHL